MPRVPRHAVAAWPAVCLCVRVAAWLLPAVAGTFLRPRAVLLMRRPEAGLLRDSGRGGSGSLGGKTPAALWWPGLPMYRLCKYTCQGLFQGQGYEPCNQRKDSTSISARYYWACWRLGLLRREISRARLPQTARGHFRWLRGVLLSFFTWAVSVPSEFGAWACGPGQGGRVGPSALRSPRPLATFSLFLVVSTVVCDPWGVLGLGDKDSWFSCGVAERGR